MIYHIVKRPLTTYLLLLQVEKVLFCERSLLKGKGIHWQVFFNNFAKSLNNFDWEGFTLKSKLFISSKYANLFECINK